MATSLLLLDSLTLSSHTDPSSSHLFCRPEHSTSPSRSPTASSRSAFLDSSVFGSRDAKLSVDHAHPESPRQQHPLTCRCAFVAPLDDHLDPLPRLSRSPGEVGRLRTEAIAARPAAPWDTYTSSEFGDIDRPTKSSSPGGAALKAANEDSPTFAGSGQELELRTDYRSSPSYLSVSQSSRSSRRQAVRNGAAMQLAAAIPSRTATDFKGATGVHMAFIVFMLGITALLQMAGVLVLSNASSTICSRCDGYGIERCGLCGGRGIVTWEGKLKRTDPCPSCFGSCTRKCSSCGGVRVQKGVPPALQHLVEQRSMRRRS